MPFRGRKIAGVLNDSNNNEMSYVDMHDLHPENVEAAQLSATVEGAIAGGTAAMIPAGLLSMNLEKTIEAGEEVSHLRFNNWKTGAAIIALGAAVMGYVRGVTAKKDAETHNSWSEKVLTRMEAREAAEVKRHELALKHEREAVDAHEEQVSR